LIFCYRAFVYSVFHLDVSTPRWIEFQSVGLQYASKLLLLMKFSTGKYEEIK